MMGKVLWLHVHVLINHIATHAHIVASLATSCQLECWVADFKIGRVAQILKVAKTKIHLYGGTS